MIVLLDIEGTTTPVSFVYDVLFPFARSRMADYLKTHPDDPDVQLLMGVEGAENVERYVLSLMDQDSKIGPLKAIQGRLWEEGYRSGALKGQVFPDVPERFAAWHAAGHSVNIYSSGSVLAQKLLFGHSEAGDLTRYLNNYYDTGVGPKKEAESYRRIAQELGGTGIFGTDIVAEAEAAHAAGWTAIILDRPGNAPQPEHSFRVASDLTQLSPG